MVPASRGGGTGDLEKSKAPDFSEALRRERVHPPSRLISSDLATVVAPVNQPPAYGPEHGSNGGFIVQRFVRRSSYENKV